MISELFVENKKAPQRVKIYLSKSYFYKQIISVIIWVSIGVYAFLMLNKILGVLLILYIFFSIKEIVKNFNLIKKNKVQLELSEKGISLEGQKIINWNSILEEKVIVKPNYGNPWNSYEYLTFKAKSKKYKILINHLDISILNLEYFLKIYRKRSANEK